MINIVNNNRKTHEKSLSEYATKESESVRRVDFTPGLLSNYVHDRGVILNTRAYTRYIDKTQVFFNVKNDHITHRVLHVQIVSHIARTIGNALKLNLDLIEAISIGHDIGHSAFGHAGEAFLSELCKERGIHSFKHNAQGYRFLDVIENKNCNLNLSLQVLDGVLNHDGENLKNGLKPNKGKDFTKLGDEYKEIIKGNKKHVPMTLEGCVVRISDVISYVGRDIDDAVAVGLIERSEVPSEITRALGNNHQSLINSLVQDVVLNSYDRESISFSDDVYNMLSELKDFNYNNIYLRKELENEKEKIGRMYKLLFDTYFDDLKEGNRKSTIYRDYLDLAWIDSNVDNISETVRDYIAGMTDGYMMRTFKKLTLPAEIETYRRVE